MIKVCFRRSILEDLRSFLSEASDAFFAVAYVTCSGVKLLTPYIEDIPLRVLTCTDYFITEPDALEMLLSYGADVRIISVRENFHPKVSYFLRNSEEALAIVGSSNLSEAGLTSNIEANILLMGEPDDDIFRQISDYLEELWNHPSTIEITQSFIDKYRRSWRKYQRKRLRIIARSTPIRPQERNYWIFITSPENYRICVQEGLWGVQYATKMIKKTKPGDLAFFYIKREEKFAGPFIITSEPFEDHTQTWPDKEYPIRINIKPYKTHIEIPAKLAVPKLDFIKRKEIWGAYLQGEMREITKGDYRKILRTHQTKKHLIPTYFNPTYKES